LPLHWAAQGDNVCVVKLLSQDYWALNDQNDDGLTPLMCAISAGNENVVKLLLKLGAAVGAAKEFALQCNEIELCDLLLKHETKKNRTKNKLVSRVYVKFKSISVPNVYQH
jgi:ankyrin repeat protein